VRRAPRGGGGKFNTPFWKKKYSVEDIARTAYQGVQQLRQLVNTEFKHIDTYVSNSPDNSTVDTTFVSSVCDSAEGDTEVARSGLSIKAQTFVLSGQVVKHTSATETVVRIMLIKDLRQTASTRPSTSTVLETSSGFLVNNMLNWQYAGRFKVLADIRVVTSTDKPVGVFGINLPLKGHITYSGATSTAYQSNGHFVVAASDQNTNVPTVTWSSRLTFTDN
jgi:hypothetical protein